MGFAHQQRDRGGADECMDERVLIDWDVHHGTAPVR
jgi:hypothetical protein